MNAITLTATATQKTCTRCGQRRPLKAFNKKSASPDGHQSSCRACCRTLRQDRERSRRQIKVPRPILFPGDGIAHVPLSNGDVSVVDEESVTDLMSSIHWQRNSDGYVVGELPNGKPVQLHRLIANVPAGVGVDHRDGEPLNNRKANLRIATPSQNRANSRKQSGTSSIYKGVCWDRSAGRWEASIRPDNQLRHLGYFDDELAASLAYDRAAREAWGEFAAVNHPLPGERGCRKEA